MPAFYPDGPIHLPPVAHHGDGYKDAMYEDYSHVPYTADYSAPHHHSGQAPYSGHIDRYTQPAPSAMYNPAPHYQADDWYPDHPCLHPIGAPMLNPIGMGERVVPSQNHMYGQTHGYATVPEPTYPKEEKASGGVSAKLDYDMEQMTDFVCETTVAIISSQACPVSAAFRKWVLQVLNATRLPSATIILSLSYLAIYVREKTEAGTHQPSERLFYKMTTTALILGSKFLDDNTFQNKSWAEVSNIPIRELNQDEREWLMDFGHRLHYDPRRTDGFDAAQQQWRTFQEQVKANKRLSALQPLDTNIKRHRSMQALSSAEFYPQHQQPGKSTSSHYSTDSYAQQNYATPMYTQYDPWFGYRTMEHSPMSSASHSGPQTPEYLNGSAHGWGPFQGQYARAPPYGYSGYTPTYTPTYTPQSSATPAEYQLPPFRRQCHWSTHGAHCQCQSCRYSSPMHSRYGHAVAA